MAGQSSYADGQSWPNYYLCVLNSFFFSFEYTYKLSNVLLFTSCRASLLLPVWASIEAACCSSCFEESQRCISLFLGNACLECCQVFAAAPYAAVNISFKSIGWTSLCLVEAPIAAALVAEWNRKTTGIASSSYWDFKESLLHSSLTPCFPSARPQTTTSSLMMRTCELNCCHASVSATSSSDVDDDVKREAPLVLASLRRSWCVWVSVCVAVLQRRLAHQCLLSGSHLLLVTLLSQRCSPLSPAYLLAYCCNGGSGLRRSSQRPWTTADRVAGGLLFFNDRPRVEGRLLVNGST